MKRTQPSLLRTPAGLGLMRSWLNSEQPTPGQLQVAQKIAQKTVAEQTSQPPEPPKSR